MLTEAVKNEIHSLIEIIKGKKYFDLEKAVKYNGYRVQMFDAAYFSKKLGEIADIRRYQLYMKNFGEVYMVVGAGDFYEYQVAVVQLKCKND